MPFHAARDSRFWSPRALAFDRLIHFMQGFACICLPIAGTKETAATTEKTPMKAKQTRAVWEEEPEPDWTYHLSALVSFQFEVVTRATHSAQTNRLQVQAEESNSRHPQEGAV